MKAQLRILGVLAVFSAFLQRIERRMRWIFEQAFGLRLPAMPNSRCVFERLGLRWDATPEEVQDAFDWLVCRGTDAVTKQRLEEARRMLLDPGRREVYRLVKMSLVRHGVGPTGPELLRRIGPLSDLDRFRRAWCSRSR